MKKLLLVCLFVMGVSAISFAQGQRQTPEEQIAAMKTSLKLTDDQATKLKPIFAARAKTLDSLFTGGGDPSTFREKMAPVTAKFTAQLNTVLTPEQATAYQKEQTERRARFQQGGGGN